MYKIQHITGPDSDGYINGPDESVERTNLSKNERLIIQQANNNCKLINVLKDYNISIERNGSDDWSNSITCPFPFHKSGNERSASFGYNYQTDRFHCFGCNSSGGAVEFIAFKERQNKIIIAERIVRDTVGYIPPQITELEEDQNPIIEKLMVEFSQHIHNIIYKNRQNGFVIEQIDKITWWFDNYIVYAVPKRKVFVDELTKRISKCKELLEQLHE